MKKCMTFDDCVLKLNECYRMMDYFVLKYANTKEDVPEETKEKIATITNKIVDMESEYNRLQEIYEELENEPPMEDE